MNAAPLMHVVLVFLFLLCMNTSSFAFDDDNLTRCIETETTALLVFKQGLGIADMHNLLPSWNKEEDCCKWEGVGCDNRTGHVTHLYLSSLLYPSYHYDSAGYTTYVSIGPSLLHLSYLKYLDLSSNSLTGIPKFIGSLTKLVHLDLSNTQTDTWKGKSFPYQIGNLTNLQHLDLSFSKDIFSNVPIPKFISSLNKLRYLDLSYNMFTGDIPHELGNLSELQHLDLANYNDGLGTPSGNFGWLYNLSSLTHLDLSYISIDHSSVWVSFIQRLPLISVLRLNYCNLSVPSSLGKISSSISTLVLRGNNFNSSIFYWLLQFNGSLVELDLGINMLEGRIPESFGYMTALTRLNLGHNLLNGPIPESFGHLNDLTYLDISANHLNGVLPKSIHNLSKLNVVDFSSNNFTGNLEDLLSGTFPLLQELWLSENQLTGSLPDISLLSSLTKVQVSFNHLNGYLPTVFENHSELKFLDLSNNRLRGSLPDFTGFSSLIVLNLSRNEFSGSLPDFTGCSSLQVLRLGENKLTEWETQSTGLLSSLVELNLAKNSIRSTISEAHLSNLSSLEYLNTSSNLLMFDLGIKWRPPFKLRELSLASCKLGPNFPNWIQNQESIDHLDISNSQISDTIPIWFWNLSSIKHLNLSSNKIRGKISSKLLNVQDIDLSSNYFEGPLPPMSEDCVRINLSQNKFSGTLLSLSHFEGFYIRFVDFSHNQLSGALPDNWTHFRGLAFLNLGYNNLSGKIPTSIGQLESLRALILRNNMLYGELPASLTNCSYLEFVDFGLNKLSGRLPPWIGEGLPQLYALILKSNRFSGSIPYEICRLSNLYFLDMSINRISGIIPPCFGNFTAMIQKGTEVDEHIYSFQDPEVLSPDSLFDSYTDDVLARWKGQELAFGRNFAYLKMIDLSTNELTGEIPKEIGRLQELRGLNLSGNSFYGHVPLEIGQLKLLEFIDLSTNKFSGEIPRSMNGLNFLAVLDLSNNNFSGRIPSGTQLQGFNLSTYEGNIGLCGKPLTNKCPGDEPVGHFPPSSTEYEVDEDNSEYERWLYISAVLGFSTTFWGIIGTLVLHRRWRRAYFLFLDNLKNNLKRRNV
ncbi:receptor-like protein EIX2 [Apium graveolens]|uniref:receptor-like protein EIX2 n=1 Tax=Apium graveolens TaxID=4045 RepID=UPI003D7A4123